jgi:hypothetical protein
MPRSRKCGFIHPLLHTSSWRSAYLVEYRDNFTFKLQTSGIWWNVSCWKSTDVSEEYIASIFRIELAEQDTSVKTGGNAFSLVSCSAYSAVKMEAICSSEISTDFQRTTQRYISEVCCENLTSYIKVINYEFDQCRMKYLLSALNYTSGTDVEK